MALARALVVRPALLLLDEPLSNLDAKLRQSMREEIRRLCKSAGLTTIYVTHDQKEALAIADRIAVMRKGRILQIGTPTEVYRRPQSRAVATFIGETNLLAGTGGGEPRRRGVRVDSPIGPLVAAAAHPTFSPAAGSDVWISIRPESVRVPNAARNTPEPVNTARADAVDGGFLYLGEIAERKLRVGDVPLISYELNPRRDRRRRRLGRRRGRAGGRRAVARRRSDRRQMMRQTSTRLALAALIAVLLLPFVGQVAKGRGRQERARTRR